MPDPLEKLIAAGDFIRRINPLTLHSKEGESGTSC